MFFCRFPNTLPHPVILGEGYLFPFGKPHSEPITYLHMKQFFTTKTVVCMNSTFNYVFHLPWTTMLHRLGRIRILSHNNCSCKWFTGGHVCHDYDKCQPCACVQPKYALTLHRSNRTGNFGCPETKCRELALLCKSREARNLPVCLSARLEQSSNFYQMSGRPSPVVSPEWLHCGLLREDRNKLNNMLAQLMKDYGSWTFPYWHHWYMWTWTPSSIWE